MEPSSFAWVLRKNASGAAHCTVTDTVVTVCTVNDTDICNVIDSVAARCTVTNTVVAACTVIDTVICNVFGSVAVCTVIDAVTCRCLPKVRGRQLWIATPRLRCRRVYR